MAEYDLIEDVLLEMNKTLWLILERESEMLAKLDEIANLIESAAQYHERDEEKD